MRINALRHSYLKPRMWPVPNDWSASFVRSTLAYTSTNYIIATSHNLATKRLSLKTPVINIYREMENILINHIFNLFLRKLIIHWIYLRMKCKSERKTVGKYTASYFWLIFSLTWPQYCTPQEHDLEASNKIKGNNVTVHSVNEVKLYLLANVNRMFRRSASYASTSGST